MLHTITETAVLAAGYAGDQSAAAALKTFFDSPVGGVIGVFMASIGILVALIAIFRAIKDIVTGKLPAAIKTIIGGFVIAAILIAPVATLGGLIDGTKTIVTKIASTIDGNAKTTNPTTPPDQTPAAGTGAGA